MTPTRATLERIRCRLAAAPVRAEYEAHAHGLTGVDARSVGLAWMECEVKLAVAEIESLLATLDHEERGAA